MSFQRKPLPLSSVRDTHMRTVLRAVEDNLQGLEDLIQEVAGSVSTTESVAPSVSSARLLTVSFYTSLNGFVSAGLTIPPLGGWYMPWSARVVAATVRLTGSIMPGGTFRFFLDNHIDPSFEFVTRVFSGIGAFQERRTYASGTGLLVTGLLSMTASFPPGWGGTAQDVSGLVVLEEVL